MVKIGILTEIENRVLNKKLNNHSLTQVESNYLSRSIRPKLKMLKELSEVGIASILERLTYNQKGIAIEEKIKNLILSNVSKIDAIIIFGSAIQTNYSSYGDLDVLIITKTRFWRNEKEKYSLIKDIRKKAKEIGLNLDVQIRDLDSFYLGYSSNPDLLFQLKDSKVIYGKVNFPKEISLSKIDLHMKLDWSDIENTSPNGGEIFQAIRNALLVKLLLNRTIDNYQLKASVYFEIGRNLAEKLKNNKESLLERKFALAYLKDLCNKIRQEIGGATWEKIEL